jgi:mannose-6-phosphate isomerase-like protein (cupin superfamily)
MEDERKNVSAFSGVNQMIVITKRLVLAIGVVLLSVIHVLAQNEGAAKKPTKPIREVVVMRAQSLTDLQKKLQPSNKAEDLIGGAGMELRVAIQHENNTTAANAEIHDASDDVYYVLDGTATLTLGGTLESPKEVGPGEWRGPRIEGGQKVEIAKGDLIVVPRGTPHHRSTANQNFTMILIKVFEDPLPATSAAPTVKPAP